MDNGEPIRAEVSSECGSLLGEVLDLSLYGCSVRVPLTQAPIVPVGGTVSLTLHASDTKSVTITATVQASTGRDKFRRMGLAFSNPAALHAMLSPKLLRWFNERRALRVQPRPPVSVAVDVPGQERRLTGRMLDISAEGVGVVVDGESAQELSQVVRVGLEFTLPGHTVPRCFEPSSATELSSRKKQPSISVSRWIPRVPRTSSPNSSGLPST